jgi:hypothetical protein
VALVLSDLISCWKPGENWMNALCLLASMSNYMIQHLQPLSNLEVNLKIWFPEHLSVMCWKLGLMFTVGILCLPSVLVWML